ncbi:MAG: hypothetical protein F2607_03305, partial [Actinobacteria bacterium]|nr:hypothetical protein [Actinomycetota bacterium]
MPSPRPRRRSAIVFLIALLLLAVAGAGVWKLIDKPQTRSAEELCAQLGQVTSLSSSLVTLDPTTLGPQVAELQRATSVAPSDIQAQLNVLATFVDE